MSYRTARFLSTAVLSLSLAAIDPMRAAAMTSCEFRPSLGNLVAGQDQVSDRPELRRRGEDILVDGASCGATIRNTDSIRVLGSDSGESLTLNLAGGPFAPGRMPEADGSPEIEISVDLKGPDRPGYDSLVIEMTLDDDTLVGNADGLDLTGDEDVDVTPVDISNLLVDMREGSDELSLMGGEPSEEPFPFESVDVLLDAGADEAILAQIPPGDEGAVFGGPGDDVIRTGSGGWRANSNAGDDVLVGGSGDDELYGGWGSDTVRGRGGDDRVWQLDAKKQRDTFVGGEGVDELLLNLTSAYATSVTLDERPNDGAPGELDNVSSTFETVVTGKGKDVLVGNELAQTLSGGLGKDDITGLGGRDILRGGLGDDVFHATDGRVDRIWGGDGTDTATDKDPLDRVHHVEAI